MLQDIQDVVFSYWSPVKELKARIKLGYESAWLELSMFEESEGWTAEVMSTRNHLFLHDELSETFE